MGLPLGLLSSREVYQLGLPRQSIEAAATSEFHQELNSLEVALGKREWPEVLWFPSGWFDQVFWGYT